MDNVPMLETQRAWARQKIRPSSIVAATSCFLDSLPIFRKAAPNPNTIDRFAGLALTGVLSEPTPTARPGDAQVTAGIVLNVGGALASFVEQWHCMSACD